MIRFAFEILDRVSGPARKMSKSVEMFDKSLGGSVKSVGLFERMTKGAMSGLSKAAGMASDGARRSFGEMRSGLSWLAGGTVDLAATMTKALAAAAITAAAFVGKSAVDALRFKQDTGFALRFTLGSAKAAEQTMGDIVRIANILGTSSQEATGAFRALNKAGFDTRESEILLQLAADLKVLNNGREVAMNAITEPLQAIKSGGSLNIDSFKFLEEAGVSRKQLYEKLAASLGVVADKNASVTKARVDKALAAIPRGQKAMEELTRLSLGALGEKELGQIAQEFQDTTVTGAIDKIKSRWENLMMSVEGGEVGKSLVRILESISTAIDPGTESGKKLLATLNSVASAAADAFGKFDVNATVAAVTAMTAAVQGAIEPIRNLGRGFMSGFGEAKTTVTELVGAFGGLGGSIMPSADAIKTIGKALGYFVVGVGAALGAIVFLEVKLAQLAVALFKPAVRIGAAIIEGIASGLASAKEKLTSILESITDAIPESVRKILKIESPSKVMRQLGAYTVEGFAQGVDGGAPDVASAAKASIAAPVIRATVTGGGSRGSVVIESGAVQINASGADIDEEKLARLVEERMRSLLIGLNLESA